MHEMAITQSVIAAVCGHAAGRKVHSVTVAVGTLCAVVPDAMQFCFELAAEGTVAEGARLEIEQVPGRASCRSCGADFTLTDLMVLCHCGSADVDVISGRELRIRSMEVSEECAQPADVVTTQQP
ncbi:hydrogenase maturation nickel metallochaperone HypA [Nocardia sp. NBC_01009]|uniref:hydrogenase maturation nickel metallochaperone HypA n=1 Tax=Nocardia sp. NBC_01009 TaxID=2975996 RepID=UPI003865A0D4|nr:hydrogenase maturation nickel metallochaperone HypA [Nocardia sp. NBC_01009]